MRAVAGVYLGILLDDRRYTGDLDTFCEGHEFHVDGNLVSCRIGLEGKGQAIHDLSRPCVLDFQSLIEFQCFVGEALDHRDILLRVKVAAEGRTHSRRS